MRSHLSRKTSILASLWIAGALVLATPSPATAQQPSAPQQPSVQLPAMPSIETILTLVRGTMIALAQAHETNNYTVLRDLGAPGFQSANAPQRLSEIFSSVRSQGVDIGVILIVPPELSAPPSMDKNGMIRLTGFFPTDPRVNFDLLYVLVGNKWRHFGLSMSLTKPAPVASNAQAPAPVQKSVQNSSSGTSPSAAPVRKSPSPDSKKAN